MNIRVAPEAATPEITLAPRPAVTPVIVPILLSISLAHMINDATQALLPAMYPLFKQSLG